MVQASSGIQAPARKNGSRLATLPTSHSRYQDRSRIHDGATSLSDSYVERSLRAAAKLFFLFLSKVAA